MLHKRKEMRRKGKKGKEKEWEELVAPFWEKEREILFVGRFWLLEESPYHLEERKHHKGRK